MKHRGEKDLIQKSEERGCCLPECLHILVNKLFFDKVSNRNSEILLPRCNDILKNLFYQKITDLAKLKSNQEIFPLQKREVRPFFNPVSTQQTKMSLHPIIHFNKITVNLKLTLSISLVRRVFFILLHITLGASFMIGALQQRFFC